MKLTDDVTDAFAILESLLQEHSVNVSIEHGENESEDAEEFWVVRLTSSDMLSADTFTGSGDALGEAFEEALGELDAASADEQGELEGGPS